jgi:hypothetical protein
MIALCPENEAYLMQSQGIKVHTNGRSVSYSNIQPCCSVHRESVRRCGSKTLSGSNQCIRLLVDQAARGFQFLQ